MPQVVGTILGTPEIKTGEGKNGQGWTQYKYSVLTPEGKRSMTTFDGSAGVLQDGGTYTLTYSEKPNPRSAKFPYLNLESWVKVETAAAVAPTAPVYSGANRGDFMRSREQCTLENLLIATHGGWDDALALYDKVTQWESNRVNPVESQPESEASPVVPVTASTPAVVVTENTYDALKALNQARFKDGVEVISVSKLAAMSKGLYQKTLRDLSAGQVSDLIKEVTSLVSPEVESVLPF